MKSAATATKTQANALALLTPITTKDKIKGGAETTGEAITSVVAGTGSVLFAFGKGLKKGFTGDAPAKPSVGQFRDPAGNMVNCEVDKQGKPIRILS